MTVLDSEIVRAWPHALAALVRSTGDVVVAEDAVQDAVIRLLASGAAPARVDAWLITVARRVVIDQARRRRAEQERLPLLIETGIDHDQLELVYHDDRLAMLHLACDPSLGPDTRLALALRFVLGVSTADIADVMLVRHTAMSARLTRAKQQVSRRGIGEAGTLRTRIPDMLAAVHALFTIGHSQPSGTTLSDMTVQVTAVELAAGLHARFPEDPETAGLLALLLFVRARSATRSEPLEIADRSRWDRADTGRAMELAIAALPHRGRFALEAGIAGVHSAAPSWDATDWHAITALYDRLIERWPSPTARLGRAIALSHIEGSSEEALADVDAAQGAPERHIAAARAHILRRLGRAAEAREQYHRAMLLEGNAATRAWLAEQESLCR